MFDRTKIETALSSSADFVFGEASSLAPRLSEEITKLHDGIFLNPPLGPLAAFSGSWTGTGFNTIFRPDSSVTPTPLPIPVTGSDNILELNLTSETLSFSKSLGTVPNRGFGSQADALLNGVPYLQSINDVTINKESVGIHLEPGLWIVVPATTTPQETVTVARMASIPHGTTIVAQGTARSFNGPPNISSVDITPFDLITGAPIRFASQTATNQGTPRIPQDLSAWISAGTITQAMLDDPNSLLRAHIRNQNIVRTTEIRIATNPEAPLFGGGTDNIAFLQGDPSTRSANANAVRVTATFWIETVEHIIRLPAALLTQQGPFRLPAGVANVPGQPLPILNIPLPPSLRNVPPLRFHTTQIQYTQTVFLNFGPLSWPHVSVATLVPAHDIDVPVSAWALAKD
jgi:hypothetical protein